jgi:hypothetical protein
MRPDEPAPLLVAHALPEREQLVRAGLDGAQDRDRGRFRLERREDQFEELAFRPVEKAAGRRQHHVGGRFEILDKGGVPINMTAGDLGGVQGVRMRQRGRKRGKSSGRPLRVAHDA